MTEIRLDDITKLFGEEVVAVDGVSLTVEDGELVVLVGPSGSGKSTTLRMIAGLETPTTGNIFIGGENVTDVEPQDRDIAMVFQSFALYPHRSARGNLSFPMEARGVPEADRERRVRETADVLGITELLDRKPARLSGGQQQRVALGRAIVRDPRAFLMDEPLANLDAKLRKEMRTEVARLQQDLGVTMVHVTHNQEEAMTMGDRVAVMHRGEVQQFAPPAETYRRPANRFVAEFIGSPSMNLLDGEIDAGTFAVEGADVTLSVPERLRGETTADRVTLGVRPENVAVVGERDPLTFSGTVEVVEMLGNVQEVHVRVGGTEFLAEVDPDYAVEPGETVRLRPDPAKVHLFDGVGDESPRVVPDEQPRQVDSTAARDAVSRD